MHSSCSSKQKGSLHRAAPALTLPIGKSKNASGKNDHLAKESPISGACERTELAMLALGARQRAHQFTQERTSRSSPSDMSLHVGSDSKASQLCLRRYHSTFQEIVDMSDILLEVLDIRDPLACRLEHAENTIRSKHGEQKSIVHILNKVDLIPSEIAQRWVSYFRAQNCHVIPFSAPARPGAHHHRGGGDNSPLARRCVDDVFDAIRNIRRTHTGTHRSVTVGVLGYPNVGKSSVINALKRKTVVGVANRPGSTKGPTEVELRQGVKIVDCPGVVFDGGTENHHSRLALLNAVPVSEIADPVSAVGSIVARVGCDALCKHYGVEPSQNLVAALERVGKVIGRLRAGGIVDEEATARCVLQDWNSGKLAFYAFPPDSHSSHEESFSCFLTPTKNGLENVSTGTDTKGESPSNISG